MKIDNKIYLYDGTFINLICLIQELIDKKIKPLNIKDEQTYEHNLIDLSFKMKIISNKNCIDILFKKTSFEIVNIVYHVFLSDDVNKEIIIYYFIINALKHGEKIVYLRNLKCVCEALRINKYVLREAHRLKGFIRFKEYENSFLYAHIEPTNNVIYLLTDHFAKRLKNENWIIHDKKRNIIAIYDCKKTVILENEVFDIDKFNLGKKEINYEELWKTFFETVGIKERSNKRCQMNFMPKKYWKNILEMENKI